MSNAGHGNKGDSNRVKDHKNYGEKFDMIKQTHKPRKSWETEASKARRDKRSNP
jgi:hypothetical protein